MNEEMKKLSKLHDGIKANKFRSSPSVHLYYADAFFETWFLLENQLRKMMNSGKYPSLDKIVQTVSAFDFAHDLRHHIIRAQCDFQIILGKFGDFTEKQKQDAEEELKKELELLEFVLISVHVFCNTGIYTNFFIEEFGYRLYFSVTEHEMAYMMTRVDFIGDFKRNDQELLKCIGTKYPISESLFKQLAKGD